MSKNPPNELGLGYIWNMVSEYQEGQLGVLDSQCDQLSVALQLFLDGYDGKWPHIWNADDDAVPYDFLYLCHNRNQYSLNSPVDKLMKLAHQAPFGDLVKGETTVDSDVRHCYQIIPNNDIIIDSKFPKTLTDQIKHTLFPNRDEIEIVFNKINIYPVGGHFTRHVDTPKPDVIGTVVVFGGDYEGGELVICNDDKEHRYTEGIVAFYSNMPHWVEPVTKGTRVTATYYIMQKSSEPEPELESESEHLDVKNILLRQPFGIVLSETYSTTEDMVFKGDDLKLEPLLKYFSIDYLPVLIKYNEIYYEDYKEGCDYTARIYRCTPDDFKAYQNKQAYKDLEYTNLACYRIPKYDVGGHVIDNFFQGYIDYVGNECQQGIVNNTYFSRIVIFTANQQLL